MLRLFLVNRATFGSVRSTLKIEAKYVITSAISSEVRHYFISNSLADSKRAKRFLCNYIRSQSSSLVAVGSQFNRKKTHLILKYYHLLNLRVPNLPVLSLSCLVLSSSLDIQFYYVCLCGGGHRQLSLNVVLGLRTSLSKMTHLMVQVYARFVCRILFPDAYSNSSSAVAILTRKYPR
jgi:hypothetical protein